MNITKNKMTEYDVAGSVTLDFVTRVKASSKEEAELIVKNAHSKDDLEVHNEDWDIEDIEVVQ